MKEERRKKKGEKENGELARAEAMETKNGTEGRRPEGLKSKRKTFTAHPLFPLQGD